MKIITRVPNLCALIIISAFLTACDLAKSEEIVPAPLSARGAADAPTNSDAMMLAQTLDGMQVESHWLKGIGVDWITGEPNAKQVPLDDTHCSAFVAAAAYRLGVYVLRPPEHKTTFLANAQNDWLNTQGAAQGWERVEDGVHVQEFANQGYLVVASYKNPNPQKHGHIAIVRPSDKSIAEILSEGPQIIQAGEANYNSTSLKQGFRAHPTAFPNNQIQFFEHKIDLKNSN